MATFGNQVVMNPVQLAALLRGRSGPVYRHGLESANLVKREAVRTAPVYAGDSTRRKRSPGTLRDSIVVRVVERSGDPVFQVGSADPVMLWVTEGTVPHLIEGNPLLTFYWPKMGRVVSFPRVNHPGTKPNRFLVESLTVLQGR